MVRARNPTAMAAAIATRVALAGASLGRDEAAVGISKISHGSLSVHLRSRVVVQVEACQSLLRFESGCNGLRDVGPRRGGCRFVPWLAVRRVLASSAVENKVSQGESPRAGNESSGEAPQV